ncbi:MAG: tetratricopeptide repeat protein [Deltaproteobacteria bacterium]|nr:tetratricopeptide repeat protein [Deltaproteobacteria bacterium]
MLMNRDRSYSAATKLVGALALSFVALSCTHHIPRFGIGGRYEEGKDQFLRGRAGDMDVAIAAFETVVKENPKYNDSLTYLGRAYYRKGRYFDAFEILQRALAVNKEDEIAWISIGLTQLRLGQNEKGVETLKSGITLANRVMKDGYKNYLYWDSRGVIAAAIRRSAFLLAKGAEERNGIIEATDRLLALVDDEDNFQRNTRTQTINQQYGR